MATRRRQVRERQGDDEAIYNCCQSLHVLAVGILQGNSEKSLEEVADFRGERMAGGSVRKIIQQTLCLQGFSAVGVGRAAVGVVPG